MSNCGPMIEIIITNDMVDMNKNNYTEFDMYKSMCRIESMEQIYFDI